MLQFGIMPTSEFLYVIINHATDAIKTVVHMVNMKHRKLKKNRECQQHTNKTLQLKQESQSKCIHVGVQRRDREQKSYWAKGATTGGGVGGSGPPTFWRTPNFWHNVFVGGGSTVKPAEWIRCIIQKKKGRKNSSCYYCRYYPLFITHQHTDARYWYSNSVRPSVRLSVRP